MQLNREMILFTKILATLVNWENRSDWNDHFALDWSRWLF